MFLSYRKKKQGGVQTPPPVGRGLMCVMKRTAHLFNRKLLGPDNGRLLEFGPTVGGCGVAMMPWLWGWAAKEKCAVSMSSTGGRGRSDGWIYPKEGLRPPVTRGCAPGGLTDPCPLLTKYLWVPSEAAWLSDWSDWVCWYDGGPLTARSDHLETSVTIWKRQEAGAP